MKVDLSTEVLDGLVYAALKEHVRYVKKNIKELNALNKDAGLKPYQADDLANEILLLDSMKRVLTYFGG
jgi:hypothetical protein